MTSKILGLGLGLFSDSNHNFLVFFLFSWFTSFIIVVFTRKQWFERRSRIFGTRVIAVGKWRCKYCHCKFIKFLLTRFNGLWNYVIAFCVLCRQIRYSANNKPWCFLALGYIWRSVETKITSGRKTVSLPNIFLSY